MLHFLTISKMSSCRYWFGSSCYWNLETYTFCLVTSRVTVPSQLHFIFLHVIDLSRNQVSFWKNVSHSGFVCLWYCLSCYSSPLLHLCSLCSLLVTRNNFTLTLCPFDTGPPVIDSFLVSRTTRMYKPIQHSRPGKEPSFLYREWYFEITI